MQEKETQDARGSRNPPEKKGGKRKTRQGEPHQPRRKKKNATRPRNTEKKFKKNQQNCLGKPRLVKGAELKLIRGKARMYSRSRCGG